MFSNTNTLTLSYNEQAQRLIQSLKDTLNGQSHLHPSLDHTLTPSRPSRIS